MIGRNLHCISYLILPRARESYRFRGLGNTSGRGSRKQTRIEPGFDEDVEPEGRQGWHAAENNSSVDFDKSTSSQIVCAWETLQLFTYVVMATLIPFQIGSFPRKTLIL